MIRTDIAVLYVGDEAEKQALLLGEPGLFFTTPGYDGWPLVMLRLAEVDAGRLAELVTDAWRMRAPYELAAGLDPGLQEEARPRRYPGAVKSLPGVRWSRCPGAVGSRCPGAVESLPGCGESATEAAAGDQLGRDHVALDLVGALADDHQRRVPEVPLDVDTRSSSRSRRGPGPR